MTNVINHPSSVFLADVKAADPASRHEMLSLWMKAIENGWPRKSILEHFRASKKGAERLDGLIDDLWSWCGDKEFNRLENEVGSQLTEKSDLTEIQSNTQSTSKIMSEDTPAKPADELQEKMNKAIGNLGWEDSRAQNAYSTLTGEFASTHKYGFFPPGWEIDSADWEAHFGPDDPCVTLVSHLQELFSASPALDGSELSFKLDTVDQEILNELLSATALHLQHSEDHFVGVDITTIRKVLNASCPAWV